MILTPFRRLFFVKSTPSVLTTLCLCALLISGTLFSLSGCKSASSTAIESEFGSGGGAPMDSRLQRQKMSNHERSHNGAASEEADALSAPAPIEAEGKAEPVASPAQADQNQRSHNPAGQTQTLLNQPQIIKTADVSIQVKSLEATLDNVNRMVRQYQGILTNESVTMAGEQGQYRSANLVIRLPQAHLDVFLKGIKGVGTIQSLNVNGEDVGAEMVDHQSRIKNLKAEEEALQAVMKRAGKIPEVLEVARELSRVRGAIEEAQGRLNYLRQQVAYSTINLSLSEQALASASVGKPGWDTVIQNAWSQSMDALDGLVRMALTIGVWALVFILPLLAVLAGVAYGLIRLVINVAKQVFGVIKPKPVASPHHGETPPEGH